MIILKLGGSAITKKSGYMQADMGSIARLAAVVGKACKSGVRGLVIVHGAGSFGHAPVLKYGLQNGVRTAAQKKGCRITQGACAKLSSNVVHALLQNGVGAVSIAPHGIVKSKGGRIAKLNKAPITRALSRSAVPVLYGDMVPDSLLGFSVCSGDQIVAHLGKRAKFIVLATNVDGVLVHSKVVPQITRRNFAQVSRHLSGSAHPDVTGGMAGKMKEVMRTGKRAFIVNAKKPSRVLALLLGKQAVCTRIN
jgi:isopentenyl phosphate kinase